MMPNGQAAGLASRSRQIDEGFRWDFQSATGFGLQISGFTLTNRSRSRFEEGRSRDFGEALFLVS